MSASKTIITTTFALCAIFASNKATAQVAIGKTEITNESVLLEFGTENKGIIVPQVEAAPNAVGGTFIYNSTDKAMEVYEEVKGGWTKLTDDNGTNNPYVNDGVDNIAENGAGAIIGAETTDKPGALVLESTTKALVLPQVADPAKNIKGAVAGTMVYDTTADMLAVFDGQHWRYWK